MLVLARASESGRVSVTLSCSCCCLCACSWPACILPQAEGAGARLRGARCGGQGAQGAKAAVGQASVNAAETEMSGSRKDARGALLFVRLPESRATCRALHDCTSDNQCGLQRVCVFGAVGLDVFHHRYHTGAGVALCVCHSDDSRAHSGCVRQSHLHGMLLFVVGVVAVRVVQQRARPDSLHRQGHASGLLHQQHVRLLASRAVHARQQRALLVPSGGYAMARDRYSETHSLTLCVVVRVWQLFQE